jgi:hypothetical protein
MEFIEGHHENLITPTNFIVNKLSALISDQGSPKPVNKLFGIFRTMNISFLWHGTRMEILFSLLENGLDPDFAQVRKGYLHLASDQGHAAGYANNMR